MNNPIRLSDILEDQHFHSIQVASHLHAAVRAMSDSQREDLLKILRNFNRTDEEIRLAELAELQPYEGTAASD